ncbi:MAG TPA: hypothetical protein VGP53_00510, partial [Acidimicrobiales bacterium]|nr:hypothetical protein [Acidimicrobiales bacterium]
VQGRTMGARRIPTDLPRCRHWAIDPMFGFEVNAPAARHPAVLAYFDSGTPTPPNGNRPPAGLGDDPHGDPRADPKGIEQKITFFETGRVVDPSEGTHARTDRWPDRAGPFLAEVEAQLDDAACVEAAGAAAPTPVSPTMEARSPTPADGPSGAGGSGRLPATGGPSSGLVALMLAATALGARRLVGRLAQGSRANDG